MKKKIYISAFIIFTIMFFSLGTTYRKESKVQQEQAYITLRGTVKEIVRPVYEETIGYDTQKCQDVKVHIKDKGYNTTMLIKYSMSVFGNPKLSLSPLKAGDKVYVLAEIKDGVITNPEITERDNISYVLIIVLIYAGAIVLIGRIKGLQAIASLLLTILAVFYIIFPRIVLGNNPLVVTVLTCAGITIIATFMIAGFNKKAVSSMLGTIGGIVVAGVFAGVFGNLMGLSGISDEHSRLLVGMVDENVNYDFKGMLFAGIIIGALGACMDVSMSIASALNELKEESPRISFGKMFKAGMNIGKDMMGTMTNTLILAYTGGSFILIMILMNLGWPLYEVLNSELILEEVLRSIAGSFGLVITIPITNFVSCLLLSKKSND